MQTRLLFSVFVFACASLQAATIQIASDLINESNNRTEANVFILPNSAWALAPAGAGWISYTNTGMGPGAISPPNSAAIPWTIFTENFVLPGTLNTGTLRIWADDTASIRLDGSAVGPGANFTQDAACAAGSIGCEPNEFADISLTGLTQGPHSLTFSVYQIGNGPFGLLYSGSVESMNAAQVADTPEPATFLMVGGGLLAVAALLRRLRKL